jgi:hypothetical protein
VAPSVTRFARRTLPLNPWSPPSGWAAVPLLLDDELEPEELEELLLELDELEDDELELDELEDDELELDELELEVELAVCVPASLTDIVHSPC